MSLQYWIGLILNIITCMVPLFVLARAMKERPSKGLTNLLIVIVCLFVNGLGSLTIFLSTDTNAALIGAKICAIAKVFCLCAVTEFLAEYCHFKVDLIVKIIISILDGIIILGVLVTAHLGSYYKEFELTIENDVSIWNAKPGVCYILYLIIAFISFGSMMAELLRESFRSKELIEKKKYLIMLAGVCIPVIGYFFNAFFYRHNFNIVPFCFMLSSIFFYIGMEKYEIFDLSQNAKEYVLDHSVEAIMVVDANKNVLYMNEITKQADPYVSLYKPMDQRYEYFLDFEKQEFEEGGMHFAVHRTLLQKEEKEIQGYLIEVRDITEKYEKIKMMNELMNEAKMANVAKSTFLTYMSHEIRTPINAVLGMDEMIIRETEDPTVIEYAENIQTAGKTLLSIINDILDFSKIESGELEIVEEQYELKDVLQNAERMVLPRLEGRDIAYEMIIDPSIPRILLGDANRIQQAMINLLTNAAKYTQAGKITARVEYEKREPSIHGPEILLRFSVQDTGMGIKKEDLQKLFKSFQRIDEEKNRNIEGTGLGLTITQKLIHKMNGEISVESEYQKGSTFTLEIPQVVIDFTGISVKEGEKKAKKKYHEKFHAPEVQVLVVDDNTVNIKVLEGLLKKTKVQITAVNNGFDCLRLVKEQCFDLIFMDHMMPEMDGIETFERMCAMDANKSKDTPVIALTANAIAGAKEMYIEIGFTDYLMKPVNTEELEDMMIRYLPKEKIELI